VRKERFFKSSCERKAARGYHRISDAMAKLEDLRTGSGDVMKKKLIELAMPQKAVYKESAREKSSAVLPGDRRC
jgi:agmatine/peptidylarginine deiminase